MDKKKKIKLKLKKSSSPFKVTDKVRVRKSYYTFSKDYPVDRFHTVRRKSQKSHIRRIKTAGICFLLILVFSLSYFAMSLLLNISGKPIENGTIQNEEIKVSAAESFKESGLRALYMPYHKLSDIKYIEDFIYEIERKNGNAVLIDFKTEGGKLAFTSLHSYAVKAKANLFSNDTVRKALDLFKSEEITVIAGIYAFKDPLVSKASPELAVKYMDTDVNWQDSEGESRLNPFSKGAKGYLKEIVTELYKMGVRGFMFKELNFPSSAKSTATYPGEKKGNMRNEVLKAFIKDIRTALPKDALIILSQSASEAQKGLSEAYGGSMANSLAEVISADTEQLPEGVTVSRKEKFVSVLSMYGAISNNYKSKIFLPEIDMEDYSRYYIYKMRKAGFNSFILKSESGEY